MVDYKKKKKPQILCSSSHWEKESMDLAYDMPLPVRR